VIDNDGDIDLFLSWNKKEDLIKKTRVLKKGSHSEDVTNQAGLAGLNVQTFLLGFGIKIMMDGRTFCMWVSI
jgi:hypothetical protein